MLPCQRRILQEYRAQAVAKEAQLVARKKQQLEELKQRVNAKAQKKIKGIKVRE